MAIRKNVNALEEVLSLVEIRQLECLGGIPSVVATSIHPSVCEMLGTEAGRPSLKLASKCRNREERDDQRKREQDERNWKE